MEWENEDNKLTKEFDFNNFLEAVSFVNKLAEVAESAGHHPDVLIHSYKKVKVMLTTHDAREVTQKDYDLAEMIDGIN